MNLTGTWSVKVISGPWWFRSMNLLRDKKVITGSTGYNVLRSGLIWGDFTITRDGAEIVLTYDHMPIVDRVIQIDGDHLKGQFYLRDRFVGDFEMVRAA